MGLISSHCKNTQHAKEQIKTQNKTPKKFNKAKIVIFENLKIKSLFNILLILSSFQVIELNIIFYKQNHSIKTSTMRR